MKNVINYYYGIIVKEFKKRGSSFTFSNNDKTFEFIEYYDDVNKLMFIYSVLRMYQRHSYEIILNKNKNVITYYDNKPYILLKKNINSKNIEFDDIVNYDCRIDIKEKLNWKKLWIEKIDYFDTQLEKNSIHRNSFNYYIGLSELAINLLNYVDYNSINYYISHKRIEFYDDIFNPLNIIIDNRTRDIAEYIKTKYINDDIEIDEVLNYITQQNFSEEEIILFLARLIFPTYFLDQYEKIYIGKQSENELNKIIKKNIEYEKLLKKTYKYAKSFYNIPQIEFLED